MLPVVSSFQIGEKVVYPNQGIGTIENISTRSFGLQSERFYLLRVGYGGTMGTLTDIDREGTMTGANLKWFRKLRAATSHPIIAAGGITTRREVAALEKMGMDAAAGMAMYKNVLK